MIWKIIFREKSPKSGCPAAMHLGHKTALVGTETGKEISALTRKRNEKYFVYGRFSALKPSTISAFHVGRQVLFHHWCAKSRAGTSKRRSNMTYCRLYTTCRATMPACHELPRSRLPPLKCCMPACTTCSSACAAQLERPRKRYFQVLSTVAHSLHLGVKKRGGQSKAEEMKLRFPQLQQLN